MYINLYLNSNGKIQQSFDLTDALLRRLLTDMIRQHEALVKSLCLDTATGEYLDRLNEMMGIEK